jgi:hypothetical protein
MTVTQKSPGRLALAWASVQPQSARYRSVEAMQAVIVASCAKSASINALESRKRGFRRLLPVELYDVASHSRV